MLTDALQIVGTDAVDWKERRREYLNWVTEAVLVPRLGDDPIFTSKVAAHLRPLLIGLVVGREKEKVSKLHQKQLRQYVRIFVTEFPEIIRKRLLDDEIFCRRLRIEVTQIVTFGRLQFESRKFWKEVHKALAYGSGRVRTVQGKKRVRLTRVRETPNAVQMSGALNMRLVDPALSVLSRSAGERRAALYQNQYWFDMSSEKRDTAIELIVRTESAAGRIVKLESYRNRSASVHYRRLSERVSSGGRIRFEELRPPTPEALLNHIRLGSSDKKAFRDRLDASAAKLTNELGVTAAYWRLSALPVPIPRRILSTLGELPEDERQQRIEELSKSARTPLQLLHAIAICLELEHPYAKDNVVADLLRRLLGRWRPIIGEFIQILRWTEAAYYSDRSWIELPACEPLAACWLHASRLLEIFDQSGFDVDVVAQAFAGNHPDRYSGSLLTISPEYDEATESPRNITDQEFLYHGLAYALRGIKARSVMDKQQLRMVENLLTYQVEEQRIVSPWIACNRQVAVSILGSFCDQQPNELLGADIDLSVQSAKDTVDRIIADLEGNPELVEGWIQVSPFLRRSMTEDERERINAVLEEVELSGLIQQDKDGMAICRLIGDCVARFGSKEAKKRFLGELRRSAEQYAIRFPSGFSQKFGEELGDAHNVLGALIEVTAAASKNVALEEAHWGRSDPR
jgi:hypothetical protein